MKTNFSKKVIALLMSMLMLITCSFPTYAVEALGSYSGQIIAPRGVDLANIEIQVYSAVPVYDESNNDELLYYAETYDHSVFTDAKGYFEFNKPAQYCSLSIVLDTLPENYGISEQMQFIVPANKGGKFDLSLIDDVVISRTDGNIIPSIYNADGNKIHADYTVVSSTGYVASSKIDTISNGLSLSAIDAVSAYQYSGYVQIGSKQYSYSFEDSINDFSMIDKINVLYSTGYLSESEKISLYCDLLKNDGGYTIQSGTTIYEEIIKYRDKNRTTLSTDLSRKIDAVAAISEDPDYTDYIEATIGSYKIRVFYDASAGMEYEVVSNFVSECISVYNFFVTSNYFLAPLPYGDTAYYPIYLVPDDYMDSLGLTTSNIATGKSKIYVLYSQADGLASDYEVTLSHEFNHAVMSAYQITTAEKWFKESFSSMMALVYHGSSTWWYESYVQGYLSRSFYSITNTYYNEIVYGSLMYPLYIYTYLGGLPTIRSIYAAYSDAGNPYDAITDSPYISDYRSAFLASVSRNYDPDYYYTYANYWWGTPSINDHPIPFESTTNMSVNSMACHYQRFSSSTNIGTVYFTLEITSSNGNGMMLNKITETSTGALSISTVSTSFTRITVQQSNFGSTVKELTLIPVNTNSSGSAISYKLTVSN